MPIFSPDKLDIKEFARQSGTLSGTLALQALPRLTSACASPLPQGFSPDSPVIHWGANGKIMKDVGGEEQIWLFLQITAQLPLLCERCLGSIVENLALDFSYRFVPTEAQAAQEDAQSEEVVLPITHTFNLIELCEDELIMALPYMPLHEECPQPLVDGLTHAGLAFEVADDTTETVDPKENPFALLEQLRKKPN